MLTSICSCSTPEGMGELTPMQNMLILVSDLHIH